MAHTLHLMLTMMCPTTSWGSLQRCCWGFKSSLMWRRVFWSGYRRFGKTDAFFVRNARIYWTNDIKQWRWVEKRFMVLLPQARHCVGQDTSLSSWYPSGRTSKLNVLRRRNSLASDGTRIHFTRLSPLPSHVDEWATPAPCQQEQEECSHNRHALLSKYREGQGKRSLRSLILHMATRLWVTGAKQHGVQINFGPRRWNQSVLSKRRILISRKPGPKTYWNNTVIKTSQLMLYREIIVVYSQIHTKHINTVCGQNVELLNVKLVVHIVTTEL